MKKIIYKYVSYTDFKGQINAEFDFKDGRNKVTGENGSGKTTLAESIPFILFNKGIFGERINSEPITKTGEIKKDYNQKLMLDVEIDGNLYTIKKLIVKKSIKEMSINGKPFNKKKDFEAKLIELFGFDDDEYLLFSNPKYFNSLTNKEARNYLIGLIDQKSDLEIVEQYKNENGTEDDFLIHVKTNISKEITLDQQLNMKLCEESDIDADIKSNDIKIESKKETLQELTNIDNKEKVDVESLTKQRTELENQINNAQENNKQILEMESNQAGYRRDIATLQDQLKAVTNEIERHPEKVKELENLRKLIADEFDELNSKEVKAICALCGQENAKDLDKVEKNKQVELNKIEARGKAIAEQLKEKETELKNLQTKSEYLRNKIDITNKQLSALTFTNKRMDTTELQAKLNTINKAIGGQDYIIKINKEIDKLESVREQKLKALDNIVFERKILEEILKLKATTIEEQVNADLDSIKVKLFEIKKNGNVKPIFTVTHKGIDFARMNNAKQINAGIELLNFIQNKKGVQIPIFVDNAESVNKIHKTESQTIELYVTTGLLEVN